jgi:hypothetical protein
MNAIKGSAVLLLCIFAVGIIMLLNGPPRKSIADNCKKKFAYDQNLVAKCLATISLPHTKDQDDVSGSRLDRN